MIVLELLLSGVYFHLVSSEARKRLRDCQQDQDSTNQKPAELVPRPRRRQKIAMR